jgi:hypothetical protein
VEELKMMKKPEGEYVKVNNEEIEVFQIDNDLNGNPRYVVHFLSLGIKLADYGKIKGLVKYRAKWFGGGYVFQSHHVKEDLEWMLKQVNKYYNQFVPGTYSKDLHRKGELNKVDAMEKLGNKLIKGKDMCLAFVTEGFYDYDGFGVIANDSKYQDQAGYVLFDEKLNKPVFFKDEN